MPTGTDPPKELRFSDRAEADKFVVGLQETNGFGIAGLDECGRGCERPDADVLTGRGWLKYYDLSAEDVVLSYTDSGSIVWQKIDTLVVREYDGELLELKNKSVHMVVTPDHRFTVLQRVHKRDPDDGGRLKVVGFRNKYKKVLDLVDNDYIPRGGCWEGIAPENFILPAVTVNCGFQGLKEREEKLIPISDWVSFMGIYLSEGCCTRGKKGEYIVHISQGLDSKHYGRIEKLLGRLPIHFGKNGASGFRAHNVQLYTYLKSFGNVYTKHIPSFIKNLNPELLGIFLNWAVYGDGTVEHKEKRLPFYRYYTSSVFLRDDIEEVLLKAGWTFSSRVKGKAGSVRWIRGRAVECKVDNYCITFRRTQKIVVKHLKKSWVPYTGKVFCLSLPKHHNFYVRRSGTGYFTGNSLAGPVVSACVLLPPEHGIVGIKDSKKLSPKKREEISAQVEEIAYWGIGVRDSEEVDRLNIHRATQHAAEEAALRCLYSGAPIDYLLCDGGLDLQETVPFPSISVIKGDLWLECIGAASIVAKVYHDKQMVVYHDIWPEYGFNTNQGYGTKEHIKAILEYGMTPIHRRTFGVCRRAQERITK